MKKGEAQRPKQETVIRLCEGDPDALISTTSPDFFKRLINRGYDPEHQRIEGEMAHFRVPRAAVTIRRYR